MTTTESMQAEIDSLRQLLWEVFRTNDIVHAKGTYLFVPAELYNRVKKEMKEVKKCG